jgi:glycosyltransferase involved in cell wall biosynthesis
MRIAHVIEWLTALGGGPTSVLATLARTQAAAGHQVTVIPGRRMPEPLVLHAGQDDPIVVRPGATPRHLWWYSGPAAREIREQIAGHDIVHIHATWRYHFLAAATYAAQLGIPYVVSPHGNLDHYCLQQRKTLKWIYFQLIDRKRINAAAAIHCCSQMELREIDQLSVKSRMFVIPNPVEEKLFTNPPDHAALQRMVPQLQRGQHLISFLGRFNTIKRPEVIVRAFRQIAHKYPDWVVVLAGPHESAALTAQLSQEIQAAGLGNRILMPGTISGQAKAALLSRTDIYVQASIHENFCVSVAEAMRFAVSCIVAKEVALADEIESAQAGMVYDGSPADLARCLEKLILDPAARRQFGENGARVAVEFRPTEIQHRFDVEYERCIEQYAQLQH